MSESLRDRVARVLYEVATAGFTEVPSFDDAHEFDKADHYVATDALIAAGLVAEPRGRVRDSEVLDQIGDRVGLKDYPLANLIYDAASRMRRNENEQEATS